MDVTRRDLLTLSPWPAGAARRRAALEAAEPERLLELRGARQRHAAPHDRRARHPPPVYYREPDTLIGVGDEAGKPPFLDRRGAPARLWHRAAERPRPTRCAHLDFEALAARYGRMGGYAHLATLVKP